MCRIGGPRLLHASVWCDFVTDWEKTRCVLYCLFGNKLNRQLMCRDGGRALTCFWCDFTKKCKLSLSAALMCPPIGAQSLHGSIALSFAEIQQKCRCKSKTHSTNWTASFLGIVLQPIQTCKRFELRLHNVITSDYNIFVKFETFF